MKVPPFGVITGAVSVGVGFTVNTALVTALGVALVKKATALSVVVLKSVIELK